MARTVFWGLGSHGALSPVNRENQDWVKLRRLVLARGSRVALRSLLIRAQQNH